MSDLPPSTPSTAPSSTPVGPGGAESKPSAPTGTVAPDGKPASAEPTYTITVRGQQRQVTLQQLTRLAESGANVQDLLAQQQALAEQNRAALAAYELMETDPRAFLEAFGKRYNVRLTAEPLDEVEEPVQGSSGGAGVSLEVQTLQARLERLEQLLMQREADGQVRQELEEAKRRLPNVDPQTILFTAAQTGRTVTQIVESMELERLRKENEELRAAMAKRETLPPVLTGRRFDSIVSNQKEEPLTIAQAFRMALEKAGRSN